jgi:hypothetical protein
MTKWWLLSLAAGFLVELYVMGGFYGDLAAQTGRLIGGGLLFGVLVGLLITTCVRVTRLIRRRAAT